jgi:8-oxo-dGTP diphosphatase
VVAAAILDRGRLLAAQRRTPEELAGQWELPGGKVESGETELEALVRECREELGVLVRPGRAVGGDWPLVGGLAASHVLRVRTADVVHGVPRIGTAHAALRWVTPAEWHALPWLESDRAVLEELRSLVQRSAELDGDGVTGA